MNVRRTPNWKSLFLDGHCWTCAYYGPIFKGEKLTARGRCLIKNNMYKQRTETCLKYKPIGGNSNE